MEHRIRWDTSGSWPALVFHVLAHVEGTAHLPASLYDATYVAWVERFAGPVDGRALAEDRVVLAQAFPDHPTLARAQLVAMLFDSTARATTLATTDLAELPDRREIAKALAPISQGSELLRCAALLEESVVEALPQPPQREEDLHQALDEVHAAAPELSRYRIVCMRPLRLRGRLIGDEIWVGTPCEELELSAMHVAWQAAHEATVGEVGRTAGDLDERSVEHIAVTLLKERADEAGRGSTHTTWLSHFADAPVGRDTLPPAGLEMLERIRLSETGETRAPDPARR